MGGFASKRRKVRTPPTSDKRGACGRGLGCRAGAHVLGENSEGELGGVLGDGGGNGVWSLEHSHGVCLPLAGERGNEPHCGSTGPGFKC